MRNVKVRGIYLVPSMSKLRACLFGGGLLEPVLVRVSKMEVAGL